MKTLLRVLCILSLLLGGASLLLAEDEKKTVETGPVQVVMTTSKGTIQIELDRDRAPISVENFLSYVDKGFYDGTIFHRVISGFMIQGGGFSEQMTQKQAGAMIKNEADNGLKNLAGTIAMARTNAVNSATSQFFINTVDNGMLDHKGPDQFGYAVFGEVVSGMDVVRKIEGMPTSTRGRMGDVPLESIIIQSVKRK